MFTPRCRAQFFKIMKTVDQIVAYFRQCNSFTLSDIYAFRALIADYLSNDSSALLQNAFYNLSRAGYGYSYFADEGKRINAKILIQEYLSKNKIFDKAAIDAYVTAVNTWLIYFDTAKEYLVILPVKKKLIFWKN